MLVTLTDEDVVSARAPLAEQCCVSWLFGDSRAMPRIVPPTGPPNPPQLLRSEIRASPQPTKPDAQDARWLGDSAVEMGSPGIEDRARIANCEKDDRQQSERTFTIGLFVAQKPPYTVCFLLVNEDDACPLPRFLCCVRRVGQCWF